jgi:hypothetical protein
MNLAQTVTVTISAGSVAWYAAIVSTCLLIIQILTYLENKVSVKLECKSGYRIFNARPPYKEDTDYIVITVVNMGKRPVTVKNVGIVMKNKKDKNMLLSDALLGGSRKITDGESTDYLIEEKSVDLNKIKYFVAYDSTGKGYRGKLKTERAKNGKRKK